MMRSLDQLDPAGKRVFVRVDFNVPTEAGKVKDTTRIELALATIRLLLGKGAASVRLATHLGRPKQASPEFSTNQLKPALKALIKQGYQRIELLENLRFSPAEGLNDQTFANELMAGMDCYVNEAFSVCHRTQASIVAAAQLKPAFAGLKLVKEVLELEKLKVAPARPFVVVIGGAKVQDKLAVIEAMSKVADVVLLGGKTGLEYKAKVGQNVHIVQNVQNVIALVDDLDGLDIGPQTIALFKKELSKAKTIFWNGNLGKSEEAQYAKGTHEITRFLAKLPSYRVIGGGDTLAAVRSLNLTDQFDFVSSGGGATLYFLAGKRLPGLEVLGYY